MKNITYQLFQIAVNFAFVVAVIFSFGFFLLIIWLLIRLTSQGPGLLKQDRIGKNGKVFKCIKFRTMNNNTRQAASHEISQSAITPIGAFLRKYKIDEFPQIINIIAGEMILIGPRPCLPVQEELIEERNKRGVNDVLPGITGWSQANGVDMSNPTKLAIMDADYIANRSVRLDIKILAMTFLGKGNGDRTAK